MGYRSLKDKTEITDKFHNYKEKTVIVMIIDKQIEIMTCGKAIKYYQNLGYKCGYRTKILVSQLDIPKGSMQKVEVKCDYCGKHFLCSKTGLKSWTSK